ncbi:MAG TPA: dienelactone hydrolase family protein [Chitinophagaceae bacterium]|nr:dienelactone hydrolase family protein [Chitinophagaceae bacterium]
MEKKTGYVELQVDDGTRMLAYTSIPSGKQSSKSILVFQEAFGVNSHIRGITDRFAGLGFRSIAPELFHRDGDGLELPYTDFEKVRPHVQAVTTEGLEADVRAAYQWVRAQPGADPDQIACIGFCMGGRVSWIANSLLPLKAAISFYGGGIVPGLISRASDMHAPILMFWGGLDKHIPSDQTRLIASSLDQVGKPHIHVEISYADHGFFCDEKPSFQPAAAAESWAMVLAFLEQKPGHP